MASRAARAAWLAGWILLKTVWVGAMILVPLFGFWLASSLAAYQNASQWLALLVGLLLFPLLPVGWDLIFVWRRSKRPPEKRILTRLDRLVLRTLAINGVFLALMMWQAKASSFRALAVRGDWLLDGHDGPTASWIRDKLLGFADRFDRRPVDDHRYGTSDAAPDPSTVKKTREPDRTSPAPTAPTHPNGWPLADAADPLVAEMPDSAQVSIASVGAYLREKFPEKRARVKAVHDYVVLRLTYDNDALASISAGDYANTPSQEAPDVFARRRGVCAGYAKLMTALGKEAGLEIKYITGYIRDATRRGATSGSDDTAKAALAGYLHAWNAVLLDDEWQLIDATWDDPLNGDKPVSSTYLMTPPRLFAYDHLPEDPAWQLAMAPLSPGDFVRQPFLTPEIGRTGLTLIDPTRSQVSVDGDITIVVDNPSRARLSAYAVVDDGREGTKTRCTISPGDGTRVAIHCPLDSGEHEVRMFAAPAAGDGERGAFKLDYIGSILVNSR